MNKGIFVNPGSLEKDIATVFQKETSLSDIYCRVRFCEQTKEEKVLIYYQKNHKVLQESSLFDWLEKLSGFYHMEIVDYDVMMARDEVYYFFFVE
ncbi:hypothetical protein [Geobacillus subterraneus]|uniref:Uncharacterized protein n=1 Tax=Geobacillus subterraneus TaxID=129338 RepID=A0A679FXP2_9BACL|nr:hypothetical protein [Geobacillus subterraneus]BBW98887.1 hypothetical protein GsuE55_37200 [Geobacillus subterraneus]